MSADGKEPPLAVIRDALWEMEKLSKAEQIEGGASAQLDVDLLVGAGNERCRISSTSHTALAGAVAEFLPQILQRARELGRVKLPALAKAAAEDARAAYDKAVAEIEQALNEAKGGG